MQTNYQINEQIIKINRNKFIQIKVNQLAQINEYIHTYIRTQYCRYGKNRL